jgi:hypothetical protein
MTWSTLPAYSDGNALTAAQMTAIKDNINESAPAKASTQGYWFIAGSSANTINQRAIISDKILTQQTTTSTTYVNLTTTGATVTATTGTKALIHHGCQLFNSSSGSCWASYAISSATTVSASDEWAITCEASATNSFRYGYSELHTVTAGSNVFTQKYRVGSSTGTFDDRHLICMAL